jgi:phosphoserine phosphatase
LASLDRVSNAGVFAGLQKADIQAGAKANVKVRDQARNVLQSVSENLYILSVNWSKDWIIGALDPLQIKPSAVLSNDLEFENQLSTGKIIPSVITAGDKLTIFQNIVKSRKDSYSLYIGDSETDLPCLGLYSLLC